MPATYLDLNKKSGYGEMIDKIIEAKRGPLKKKEEEKKREQLRIAALGDLQKELTTLDTYGGRLFGANSVFNDYKFTSEAPELLSGSARKPAVPGSYEVRILQTASGHRLQSRDLAEGETLPASDFTLRLGGKNLEFHFGGGTLAAFRRLFERPDIQKQLSLESVRRGGGLEVLVLVSGKTGPNGRIDLMKDSGNLFSFLGIFTDAARAAAATNSEPVLSAVSLEGNGLRVDREQFLIEPENAATSRLARDLVLAPGETLDITVWWSSLEAEKAKSNAAGGVATADLNASMSLPLQDRITLDGDTFVMPVLKSFDQARLDALQAEKERQRKEEEERGRSLASHPPATNGQFLRVRFLDGDRVGEKVFSLPDDFHRSPEGSNRLLIAARDLNGTSDAVSVREMQFTNANTHHRLRVSWPRKLPPPPQAASNASPWKAAHELAPARPARVEYRGVVVERDANTIADLVDGVTLELRAASDRMARFRVEWNEENIFNNLVNFIGQFNVVMEWINVLINGDKPAPDAKEEVKNRWGIYRNEIALTLLKEKLRRITIDAHPTSRPEALSLLSQAGIQPIFIMGNPNDVNVGKLDLKEDQAKRVFRGTPDLVAELFAFDSDGDRVPDVGVAVDTGKLAKSYSGRAAVLEIQREASRRHIAQLEKEIKQGDQDLESYRKKLVNDFTELEKAQKEMERMGKYLDGASGGK